MTTERWCDCADHAHAAQGAPPLTWCAESRRGVGLELGLVLVRVGVRVRVRVRVSP